MFVCLFTFLCAIFFFFFFNYLLSVLFTYFCPSNPVNAAWEGHVAELPRRRLIEIGETQ